MAQQNGADSLAAVLNSGVKDSIKVQVLHRLYQLKDSVHYAMKALEIAHRIDYKTGIAQSLLDIGRWYYFAGKEDVSLSYLIKSVKLAEELGDKKILKNDYRYIGFIYRPREPFKAKDYYEKSLKMCEETGDEVSAAYALSAIGNIFEGVSDPTKKSNETALEYYLRSLKIREKKGSETEIAASLNETSRMYDALGNNSKGFELRLKGLKMAEKIGDVENIVYLSNVLGNDYAKRFKDYKNALKYQLRAFELCKAKANKTDVLFDISKAIALCYNSLGDNKHANDYFVISMLYNDTLKKKATSYDYTLSGMKHDLEIERETEKLLLKDLEIATEKAKTDKQTALRNAFFLGFIIVLMLTLLLYKGYKQKQKINNELDSSNREIEMAYRTLADSERKFKQITETINDVFYLYNIVEKRYEYISPNCTDILGLSPKYFYEGKSSKIIVHKDDLQLVKDANVKIDSGVAYDIEYRIILDGAVRWIEEKSSPIFDESANLLRNSGILQDITFRKEQEKLLEKKNKDITDSILYARTIQDAILVPKEKIEEKLKDIFILSKPKDIVSGDFYFYKETKNGIFLAVADCTGHGVPAGFMSMIGHAFLNEIVNVNKAITPAQILNQLREMIIKSLNQNTADSESLDGMDIALLYFENNNRYVQFAGAFNPLYLLRDGAVKEVEADLFPIGVHVVKELIPFTNHSMELKEGDALYIFSDGYADQLGGKQDRKLSKKQMKELLVAVNGKNMSEQQNILDKAFDDWKGEAEQVDDVLIIGIRV